MAVEDSFAQDQLRAFVERIERMEEEKAAITSDIKEIYAEAKGNGFDTKVLRKIVTIRKQDANERMEQEALLELYMSALNMVPAPPSYIEERDRFNSLASKIEADLRAPKADPLAALKADPALAIVDVADLKNKSEPQPSSPAGSDLTVSPSPQGQVAPIQPETANKAPQSDKSVEAPASAAPAPDYPAPGEVYWENTPKRPVHRHEYSAAFGDLGQDHYVIKDDISCARSAPIVMMGDTILDGWARYNCARCMVGLDGQTAQYPAVQYDGTDPLIDCIKLNAEGRILDEQQKRVIAAKLTRLEPKRKDDIYKAFGLWMEPV